MDNTMEDQENFAMVANVGSDGMMAGEQARGVAEVIAKMMVAKRFPRNQHNARIEILKECERFSFAEHSEYTFPRGGKTVSGPSIRMAEMIARKWGNIDYGVRELDQRNGESIVQAYAWDKETNTSREMTFTVKHERKAQGVIKTLDDPRDIYEMTANQGARRVRACILALIPGDIVEEAQEKCTETTKAGPKNVTMQDRIKRMVSAFDKVGVGVEQITKRLGYSVEKITATDLAEYTKIHNSIHDNITNKKDWFDFGKGIQTESTKGLENMILGNGVANG